MFLNTVKNLSVLLPACGDMEASHVVYHVQDGIDAVEEVSEHCAK